MCVICFLILFISMVTAFLNKQPIIRVIKPQLSRIRPQISMSIEDEGYDTLGTLIRFGPVPFFIRIAKPDTYNAAVLKYMNKEKVPKIEAQANMEAYFSDPNGWASNKLKEKSGKIAPIDYVNMNTDKSQLVLTGVWAVGIIGLFVRILQVNAF